MAGLRSGPTLNECNPALAAEGISGKGNMAGNAKTVKAPLDIRILAKMAASGKSLPSGASNARPSKADPR